MVKVEFSTVIKARREDVFRFVSDPRNLPEVYPKELKPKIVNYEQFDGIIKKFEFKTKILNQWFDWVSEIDEFVEGKKFRDVTLVSPFRKWSHLHIFEETQDGTIMYDKVEFFTNLSFIGDFFAKKLVESIFTYRNLAIRKKFGENLEPHFKDITRISFPVGTAICLIGFLSAFLIVGLVRGNLYIDFPALLFSWLLTWFFSHDLFHVLSGFILGIRFTDYFVGLSNLVRLGFIPNRIKFLIIALGVKVDRRFRYTETRMGLMYLAGPLASMLFPLVLSIIALRNNSFIGGLFLLISMLNVCFTLYFSYKVGCIAKSLKQFRKKSQK